MGMYKSGNPCFDGRLGNLNHGSCQGQMGNRPNLQTRAPPPKKKREEVVSIGFLFQFLQIHEKTPSAIFEKPLGKTGGRCHQRLDSYGVPCGFESADCRSLSYGFSFSESPGYPSLVSFTWGSPKNGYHSMSHSRTVAIQPVIPSIAPSRISHKRRPGGGGLRLGRLGGMPMAMELAMLSVLAMVRTAPSPWPQSRPEVAEA